MKPGAFKRWFLPAVVGLVVAAALLIGFTRSVHLKAPAAAVPSPAVKPGITFVTPARAVRDDDGQPAIELYRKLAE